MSVSAMAEPSAHAERLLKLCLPGINVESNWCTPYVLLVDGRGKYPEFSGKVARIMYADLYSMQETRKLINVLAPDVFAGTVEEYCELFEIAACANSPLDGATASVREKCAFTKDYCAICFVKLPPGSIARVCNKKRAKEHQVLVPYSA